MTLGRVFLAAALLAFGQQRSFAACTDPAAVAATRAAADQACTSMAMGCSTAKSHGEYVSCVAHQAKAAVKAVELPVPAARAAPRGEEAPVAVELLDAIVGAAPEEPAQAQARESPAEGREGREAAGLWLPRATDLVAGGASRLKFTDTTRTLAAGFTSRPALPARCRGRSYCRATRRRRRGPRLLRATGCGRPGSPTSRRTTT